MPRTLSDVPNRDDASRDLDLRALIGALKRRRITIAAATLGALVLVGIFVNVVSPRYMAEAQVLLENQETFFTRPDRTAAPSEAAVDPEAVGSQIQLITSRDLARRAVKDLQLQGNPEFDPSARGISALSSVFVLLGISRNPGDVSAETRMAQAFQEKLTVYSPPKTRVISVQFQSKNPELAARAANEIADLYIAEQSNAKRHTAKEAADALSGQIADLRAKLATADADREAYRSQYGLLAGNNNLTITGQQLADINSDLSKARTVRADAQAKATLLRDLIRSGKTADVPDVVNNDLVRRVSEQRVTAQAQLAQESRTLLPGHPRIKELQAQVAGLDTALKAAAKQAQSTLENEAKIAGQRVENLEAVLTQQKKAASTANVDEVRLRSLDRIAQSYKDQLDSSMTKYQEAVARQTSNATPADARVIARASVPQEPIYPKKLAFMGFGTIATFVFAVGLVLAAEMLKSAPADPRPSEARPIAVRSVDGQTMDVRPVRETETPGAVAAASIAAAKPSAWRAQVKASSARSPAASEPRRWGKLVAGLKAFGQSASESRPVDTVAARPSETAEEANDLPSPPVRTPLLERSLVEENGIEVLTDRILAAHIPGRGLHIVATHIDRGAEAGADIVSLSRGLSRQGRAVIVDLNVGPDALAPLTAPDDANVQVHKLSGLSELLAGQASFAEVIHRDHFSRLHFIPAGLHEADFRDFDLILDALSETYDFVVLLAPAVTGSEIAKVMAPYAHFVVLSGAKQVDGDILGNVEKELIEAGAREVHVIGRTASQRSKQPVIA